jgi:hypothetical protein
MAIDMIRFANSGDTINHLVKGYSMAPPDPGFLLGTTNDQLIILYGLRYCTQPRTEWTNKIFTFMGDIPSACQFPNMAVTTTDTDWFKRADLDAVANLTAIKSGSTNMTNQTFITPRFSTAKNPKNLNAYSLVKLPPALLAEALAAGNPQTHPLSFIRPVLETVERWSKQYQTMFKAQVNEALNIRETLPNIATSLRAFVTASSAPSINTPHRPTGTAALALPLQLLTQPPDGQATQWALKHLQNITPVTTKASDSVKS